MAGIQFPCPRPPTPARPAVRTGLDETIAELGLDGSVVVLQASTRDPDSQDALKRLAQAKWNLDGLHDLYDEFLGFYRPLTRNLAPQDMAPRESFRLRTMLVHDYRRVLLKDPEFPDVVLPTGWIGFSAHELIRRCYRMLAPAFREIRSAEPRKRRRIAARRRLLLPSPLRRPRPRRLTRTPAQGGTIATTVPPLLPPLYYPAH